MLIISIPVYSQPPSPAPFWDQGCASQSESTIKCQIKSLVQFPSAYSEYLNNHYWFYRQQVDLYESARFLLLHEKFFPNVIIGKNNWLFYSGENNIDDYECSSPFNKQELESIQARLLGWHDLLQARGIRFYVVIAPNKETIYPQYLPETIRHRASACRIDQVIQKLQSTRLLLLDLRTTMQNAALTEQVYHCTDTHWNSTSAMLASQSILLRINQDFPNLTWPSIDEYVQETQSFRGDLAALLPESDTFIENTTVLIPITQPSAKFQQVVGQYDLSYITDSDLPTAIIYCDSFTDALKPFLSEHFSRVIYERSFEINRSLVDREQPDIVIFEIAQRYLTALR